MSKLFLICGGSGAGKTTWANTEAEKTGGVAVSRDEVKKEIDWLKIQPSGTENYLENCFANKINEALLEGKDVYADSLHRTADDRKFILSKLNLDGVEVVPVWMDISEETCIVRNGEKDRPLPECMIESLRSRLERPYFSECDKYSYIIHITDVDGKNVETVINKDDEDENEARH